MYRKQQLPVIKITILNGLNPTGSRPSTIPHPPSAPLPPPPPAPLPPPSVHCTSEHEDMMGQSWVKQRNQYCKYTSWQSSSKPSSGKGTQIGKTETARPRSVRWWLSYQRPVRWGVTVKQGATTIHEDSATYTVSTSSLTIEVETDHTCHHPHRFNELATKSEK